MKYLLATAITAALITGVSREGEANPGFHHQVRPYYCGYPGFSPGHYGFGGFAGGVYGFSSTTFYSAAYAPLPAYAGGFGHSGFQGGWGGPGWGWGGPGWGWGMPGSGWGMPGSGWGASGAEWGYAGFGYGSRMGYQSTYYTHYPGMGLDYYRGPIPRYYPGPFGAPPFDPLNDYGAFGDYGYGPLGW